MTLMLQSRSAKNWYGSYFVPSCELLAAYIEIVEDQVERSKEQFRVGAERISFDPYAGDDELEGDFVDQVDEYKGLYSDTWDLESVFVDYFPSLQRRSAFLTIMAVIESEVHKLCTFLQEEKKLLLKIKDLRGMGLARDLLYLEKVVGLGIHRDSSEWEEIENIRHIRNIVAHRSGAISDSSGNLDERLMRYVKSNKFLFSGDEIGINEGFLSHVINVFQSLFQKLDESIHKADISR